VNKESTKIQWVQVIVPSVVKTVFQMLLVTAAPTVFVIRGMLGHHVTFVQLENIKIQWVQVIVLIVHKIVFQAQKGIVAFVM
jgi:hypothetical protein